MTYTSLAERGDATTNGRGVTPKLTLSTALMSRLAFKNERICATKSGVVRGARAAASASTGDELAALMKAVRYALYASTIGVSSGGTGRTSGSVVVVVCAWVVDASVGGAAVVTTEVLLVALVVFTADVEFTVVRAALVEVDDGVVLSATGEDEPLDEHAATSPALAAITSQRAGHQTRALPITLRRRRTIFSIAPSLHEQARDPP